MQNTKSEIRNPKQYDLEERTLKFAEAVRDYIKKLLNLRSSCIYPKFAPQLMKDHFFTYRKPEPTNEPYAIAKIAAIKLCRYYTNL